MRDIPCIFNAGDFVIQQEIVKMRASAVPLEMWNTGKQFFAINPVRGIGDNRVGENISTYGNFLFEFDELPLEEQKTLLRKQKDIVSMATYSGGKSIHLIVRVADMPTTKAEYRYVWELLRGGYFPLADRHCNDCLRLSRTGNATRDNGKRQILILNELQPLDMNWRPLYGRVKAMEVMKMDYIKSIPTTRTGTQPTYEAECVLGGEYPGGERDGILRNGLPWLFRNGFTLEEALENNMNARGNPASIKNYWGKLEDGFGGTK